MEVMEKDEVKTSKKEAPEASQVKTTPKYDPSKSYKWEGEDRFNLSGQEFAILIQAVGNIVKSDVSMPIQGGILLDRANQVLNAVLSRYVELGVAREAKPEPEK